MLFQRLLSCLGSAALPAAVLLFTSLAVPSSGRASIVQALSLDDLVDQSDGIFLGRVVLSETFVYPNGMLGTLHRIRAELDLLTGESGDDEVLVETLGGRMGRVGMRVEGAPSFVVGERVIVFGRKGGGYGAFRAVGMSQGVMRVRTHDGLETVTQSRSGMMLMRRSAKGDLEQSASALPSTVPLDQFLSRVREVVERKAGARSE